MWRGRTAAARAALQDVYWAVLKTLPIRLRRRLMYLRSHRRLPRVREPQSFTEKLNRRILWDHSERLAWTCDKLAMKSEVQRLAPGIRVPRTIWYGADVRELSSDDGVGECLVLKPNHRSGLVRFVETGEDVQQLHRETHTWLEERQDAALGEWAYSQARPLLLAEERLGGRESVPVDYKFFVFSGHVAVVQVDTDRFGKHGRRFYTPDWEPLEVRNVYPLGEPVVKPANLAEMLQCASRIGSVFDFMRVDLYDVDGEVYFGEVSPYPGGALERFTPRSFDVALGREWSLA